MRKIVLIVVLLTGVFGAGLVTAKLRKPAKQFVPHTIVYRLTGYDEADNLTSSEIMVRRVTADGTWRNTVIRKDGSVIHTNGKLAGEITTRRTDSNSPTLLGFSYYEDVERNPAWISSDLQDFLMFTALRANGTKDTKIEAIDISLL